jgi:hypothetical protein
MTTVAEPELAIRRYLVALSDPDSLVDRDAVARIEREVAALADPIEQLRALTRLERAMVVDVDTCAQEFAACALEWARRNGVTVNAFRQLGVTDEVLRNAGFLGRRRPAKSRRASNRAGAPSRAVTAATLQTAIPRQFGEFTFRDVALSLGGSPMTIRKAVNNLIDQGLVERVGPAVSFPGAGRAPIVFRVTSSISVSSG